MLGTHASDETNYFDTVLRLAQASEAIGIDAVFMSDHVQFQHHSRPVQIALRIAARLRERRATRPLAALLERPIARVTRRYDHDPQRTLPVLECFTTLAAIAAATERVRVGALVAGVPYRNPALLAKINTTLDLISHGRCIVGLGAGWYAEEFRAYGWAFPRVRQRLDELEEAIQIVDAMLTQRRASYAGTQHRIAGALNIPGPLQTPRPPLLIGGSGERRSLRLVAQYADYCNIFGDPPTVAHKLAVLRGHCAAVGRPYDAITRSNFVSILVARSAADLARKRGRYRAWPGHPIVGTAEQVVAELQAFVAAGIQYIIFNLPDAHAGDSLQILAEDVLPALQCS